MFDPCYNNAEIVKAVGGHHDPIVSQYSIWAITENPHLGVHDLGIDLKDIEKLPSNVRAWVLQLLASAAAGNPSHFQYLELGISDTSAEARLGLATGLKDAYCPLLTPLVLEWFTRETDVEVRSQILDHLVRQSVHCIHYEEHAVDEFERAGSNSRNRMLANAARTPLHSKLSMIKYSSRTDLFGGIPIMQNNTFNVSNMQAGAIALGGNASHSGTNTNNYNAQTLEVIQSHLAQAETEIKISLIDTPAKREALALIGVAQKEPTKDNLSKAVSAMEAVESIAAKTLGTATAIAGVAHLIARAAGLS